MKRIRPELLLLLLPLVAVGVLGTLAWREAGTAMERVLARRGEALLALARTAVDAAQEDVRRVEAAETRRLSAVLDRVETELEHVRGPVRELLERMADAGALSRIYYFSGDGELLARVVWPKPIDAHREDPLLARRDRGHARASIDRLPAEPGSEFEEGIRANAFAVRSRLGLARRLPTGAALLVRAEEAALAQAESQFGTGAVLERFVRLPDVQRIVLATSGEATFAAGEAAPAGTPVVEFIEGASKGESRLRVTLSRERVEAWTSKRRGDVLLWSGLAALAVLVGLVMYVRMVRSRRRAEERERRREHERALERENDRRLAEMGALAGLFAHEVSNPLNAIALEVGRLGATADDKTRAGIDRMRDRLASVRETLEAYLQVARSAAGGVEGRYAQHDLAASVAELGAHFEAMAEAPLALSVDARTFDLALRNLVRNAQGASPTGAAWIRMRGVDGGAVIEVHDDGPGFPSEVLEAQGRLGQALREGGHGLGLALTRRFIENAGCRLELGTSTEHGGAQATVRVPSQRVAPTPTTKGGANV